MSTRIKAVPTPVGMQTFRETIGPVQAAELLRKNITNRPLRKSWVKTLASRIDAGEWLVTHQGIAITTDNELIDGQHRLNAIVMSGKAVEVNISYDCDPASFLVIDAGIKRTSADHLRISPMLAAVGKLLMRLPMHSLKPQFSDQQLQTALEWAKGPIERVMEIGTTRTARSSAPIIMALAVHLMADRHEVLPQYGAFKTLDFDSMEPSVQSLTRQVMGGQARATQGEWDLACRTWRAFDPANWAHAKVQLKDTTTAITEMNRTVDAYKKRIAEQKRFERRP